MDRIGASHIPDLVPANDTGRTENQDERDIRLAVRDVYEKALELYSAYPDQGRMPNMQYIRLTGDLMHKIRVMNINYGIRD